MAAYCDIPALSSVYLEDSYVLGIHEHDGKIVFDLDVVLTESHPSYHAPRQGEQYCYRKATLCFLNVQSVEWVKKEFTPFSDADGASDYGNIDSFVEENGIYALEGDWGKVRIECDSIELNLID